MFVKDEEFVNSLYHYTSTEVLNIILQTSTFRASNIFYLNDSKEYTTGLEKLKNIFADNDEYSKILKKMEKDDGKSFPGLYTISFSKEPDSLHQWITYAKESGVAIELDLELLNTDTKEWVLKQDLQGDDLIGSSPIGIIKPLKYLGEEDWFQKISQALMNEKSDLKNNQIEQETVKEILLRMIASYIKNDSFKSENEFRITVFPLREGNVYSKIMYFPYKGALRPFLDVSFALRNNETLKKCLPIKSIVVGPSGKQQVVFDSIVHRITYGEVNVYEYSSSIDTIKNNFVNYINELLIWLYSKGYNNYFNEKINKTKEGDFYVKINFINTKNTFINNIKTLLQARWHNEADSTENLSNTISLEYIIDELIFNWLKENKEYLKRFGETMYSDDIFVFVDIDEEKAQIIHEIIRDFNDNFYFSKEGILVKKSQIPYIF